MERLAEVVQIAAALLYLTLAVATWRLRLRRRTTASGYVAATFTALAAVSLAGFVLPEEPASTLGGLLAIKLVLGALLAFPYLLHRFAGALSPPPRWLRRLADGGLLLLGAAVVVTPSLPGPDDPQSTLFRLFTTLFVVFWVVMFGSVAWRLFVGGQGEPTLARRRMRLLSGGASAMGLVLVVSFAGSQAADGGSPGLDLVTNLMGMGSAALFLLGFAPPPLLRIAWRDREQRALQDGATRLMAATSREEVADVLLRPVAEILGADGVTLYDAEGRTVAAVGAPLMTLSSDDATLLRTRLRQGQIVARTSPYTPFFGEDEQGLFDGLGVLADLALERVGLLDQLREANDALNEANEELEAFVYTASHDLKNPLITFLGFLEILRTDYAEDLDEQANWYLDRMRVNGDFMESLIGDLLELSRVGRVSVDVEDVDLAAVAMEVRDQLLERYPRIAVTVGSLPRVRMNRRRAQQLFTNLVENAAKYGGRPDVAISITSTTQGEGRQVSVIDDGVGIPDDHRDRVFGAFERLQADETKTQGTGIGLAICRKIVEGVGGTIHADASSAGAVIRIDLPVSAVVTNGGPDATATRQEARA